MRNSALIVTILAFVATAMPALVLGQTFTGDVGIDKDDVKIGAKEYSPYLNRAHPDRVLWGDTHLHTSYSTDAGMLGNFLGPDEAFRFARGETVRASAGERARLIRPLDFLVVADHSENLGLAPMILESNPDLLSNPWGRKIHDLVKNGDPLGAFVMWGEAMGAVTDPIDDDDLTRTIWNRIVDSAERYNEPGVFTALHGFEWSSIKDLNNLHRVVMFRDGADRVADLIPFSNYDSSDPEDLWNWMEAYQDRAGGRVMAIPHNGNLSNGLMFDDITLSGKRLTKAYAERRMQWEPIYEVTQIKGDGETHPALSPNDEFADYWRWDKGNFGSALKTPDMLPREYARQALMRGLQYEENLGANPYKFGMIGSTDSHTSLATSREENNFGKASLGEPATGQERYDEFVIQPDMLSEKIAIRHYESLASGLAGVWARENTRAAIWDAFKRKEVYATTGTRMTVRMFAGWDYDEKDVVRPDFAAHGYAGGVPMGGDLANAPGGKAPTLMVRALRDPDGANLDRIQIVKGWLDGDGKAKEKIYDVVCSDQRNIQQNRCSQPVGNTVNVQAASYTNDIGQALLGAWWRDPDFDASAGAFYYVRVLEIPTPTWLAHDKAFYGDAIELPEDALMIHQERAYTSPVWYTP